MNSWTPTRRILNLKETCSQGSQITFTKSSYSETAGPGKAKPCGESQENKVLGEGGAKEHTCVDENVILEADPSVPTTPAKTT